MVPLSQPFHDVEDSPSFQEGYNNILNVLDPFLSPHPRVPIIDTHLLCRSTVKLSPGLAGEMSTEVAEAAQQESTTLDASLEYQGDMLAPLNYKAVIKAIVTVRLALEHLPGTPG